MLETEHTRGPGRAAKRQIQQMTLHALDAWVRDASALADASRLRGLLYAAAAAGGATVVGDEFFVFPNGGVTGVLLLAQSHLSIHTWPELGLANVDLLSYGHVRAEEVLRVICAELGVERAERASMPRTIG